MSLKNKLCVLLFRVYMVVVICPSILIVSAFNFLGDRFPSMGPIAFRVEQKIGDVIFANKMIEFAEKNGVKFD